MNNSVQQYKDKFLKQHQLTYKRIYLSDSENDKLRRRYETKDADKSEIEKEFKIEENFEGIRFYTERFEDISDEEISQYISLRTIQKLESIDEKLYTIKNILIFFLIISIIGIVGLFVVNS